MENKLIDNNIYIIARDFAIKIIHLYEYLKGKQEYIISKQLFRSGTSIGANAFEGKNAQSRADFSSKMNIALKEATETAYWLDILHETNYLDDTMFESINADCRRIIGTLTKIVKATKTN